MLSAVLKRVRSVEKRLEKQANNIEELRNKIRGPLTTESDQISTVGDIKESGDLLQLNLIKFLLSATSRKFY